MRLSRLAVALGSLTTLWVLLWGSASPANVLSGLLVGVGLIVVLPGLRRHDRPMRVRPIELARLVGFMLVNVVVSNAKIVRDILSPRPRLRTGIAGVPLPQCSEELVTLITNLLALTPGTMPLELRERPRTLYVHFLHLTDVSEARRSVRRLIGLCVRAFGSDDDVRSLEASEVGRS
jgi:multicomponent Na+:H+ antiporter subunit E